jgi:hypothetical protein
VPANGADEFIIFLSPKGGSGLFGLLGYGLGLFRCLWRNCPTFKQLVVSLRGKSGTDSGSDGRISLPVHFR